MSIAQKISEAELEVLKVLWDKKAAISSTDIYNELKQSMGWEKTTVRTLVLRLTEKKALIQEKRNVYYYTPAITEKEYIAEQTKYFLKKMYKGNAKSLIASLFEQDYVNPDEIDELKQFWREGTDSDK